MKLNLTKKLFSLIILAFMIITVVPLSYVKATNSVEDMLNEMTTEEKIAQMLMPTFRYYLNENGKYAGLTELSASDESLIKEYGFAGVILFAQNNTSTEQATRLIDSMQVANASVEGRAGLFVAVDQEGGRVSRLANGTQMPGNMALGATNDEKNAYDAGKIMGAELKKMGYNVDFAPVVDVNSNPANPVIGVRSFSDDPNTVAKFGVQMMKGLQSEDILTSLKHFPGHGDTTTNSHTGLPRIEKTYDELKNSDLIPFIECIENGTDMVMTAHIQYPNIETETYTSIQTGEEIELPATLSKKILTDILREDLGFNGLIVTDAMNMDAVAKHFNKLDSAKLAINAGVDIILMPVDITSDEGKDELRQYIKDVASLADDGTISMDNVDSAVKRILELKEKNGLLEEYDGSDIENKVQEAVNFVGSKENHDKEWEIAKKSMTLVKNDDEMLPITNDTDKTVIMTAYDNELLSAEYAVNLLKDEGKISQDANISIYSYNKKELEDMIEQVKDAKNVILISEITSAKPFNPSKAEGATYAKIDQLIEYVHQNNGKVAVLSCLLPYDSARLQSADSILLAWSDKGMSEDPRITDGNVKQYGPCIPAAIYTAFSSDADLVGKLPVNIPSLDENYNYSSDILYERGYGLKYTKHEEAVIDDEKTEEDSTIDTSNTDTSNTETENTNNEQASSTTANETSNQKASTPKTGDDIIVYICILVISIIAFGVILFIHKKKNIKK